MKKDWPQHFGCECGHGQLWWQAEMKRFRCNGRCGVYMTEDPGKDRVGKWDGSAVGQPFVTREEAWQRAPSGTEPTDLF